MRENSRSLDVIVFGATGFVGKLICEYLRDRKGEPIKWGVAGRSEEKLQQLRTELDTHHVPVFVCDAKEPQSLEAMAAETKVVISTVGPYLKFGPATVRACLAGGAHYCDLTGEVPFVHDSVREFHQEAENKKLKIVHACGFDSIPSDLGSLLLQNAFAEQHGTHAKRLQYTLVDARGSFSRGTAESLIGVVAKSADDKRVERIVADANSLTTLEPFLDRDQKDVVYDNELNSWTAPFIMETINSRIVRRSNELLNFPWSKSFDYGENVRTGPGAKGYLGGQALRGGLGLGIKAAQYPLSRKVLRKFLPDEGGGPKKTEIESGFFDVMIRAYKRHNDQRSCAKLRFKGPKDPGYGSTSAMIVESALTIAAGRATDLHGVGTPAALIGTSLADSLQSRGFQIYCSVNEECT